MTNIETVFAYLIENANGRVGVPIPFTTNAVITATGLTSQKVYNALYNLRDQSKVLFSLRKSRSTYLLPDDQSVTDLFSDDPRFLAWLAMPAQEEWRDYPRLVAYLSAVYAIDDLTYLKIALCRAYRAANPHAWESIPVGRYDDRLKMYQAEVSNGAA